MTEKIEKTYENPFYDFDMHSTIEEQVEFYRLYVEFYYQEINPSQMFVSEKRFLSERCQYFIDVDAYIEEFNNKISESISKYLTVNCIHKLMFSKRGSYSEIEYKLTTRKTEAILHFSFENCKFFIHKFDFNGDNGHKETFSEDYNLINTFLSSLNEICKDSNIVNLSIPDISEETCDRIVSAIIGDNKYDSV